MAELKNLERDLDRFNTRLLVAALFVLLCFGLLGWRLVVLQVVRHEELALQAEANRIAVLPVVPNRGLIVDRNGVVLATNYSAYTLEITPSRVQGELDAVIDSLAQVLPIELRDRRRFKRLQDESKRFESLPIRTRLSDEEVARFTAQRYRFPGVDVRARLFRSYPAGEVGGHLIGYIGRINAAEKKAMDDWDDEVLANYRGTDVIGKLGLEQHYEQVLHGTTGFEEVETSAGGRAVRRLKTHPATPGNTLVLSIDIKLQALVEQLFGDRRGALVAIDPRNGEVLAFVSKPSFDPNLFVDGIDVENWRALNESIDKPLLNRALRGTYPPGSTFKPFMAMAALNSGKRGPGTIVHDGGSFNFGGHEFRSHGDHGLGPVDMRRSIVQSSNVYYYSLANEMGVDLMHAQLLPFGFGRKTDIDLDGELTGLLPSTAWKKRAYKRPEQQRWYAGETISLGIGQGYNNFTMLQLASATATLVAGGQRFEPRLVREIRDVVTQQATPVAGQALAPLPLQARACGPGDERHARCHPGGHVDPRVCRRALQERRQDRHRPGCRACAPTRSTTPHGSRSSSATTRCTTPLRPWTLPASRWRWWSRTPALALLLLHPSPAGCSTTCWPASGPAKKTWPPPARAAVSRPPARRAGPTRCRCRSWACPCWLPLSRPACRRLPHRAPTHRPLVHRLLVHRLVAHRLPARCPTRWPCPWWRGPRCPRLPDDRHRRAPVAVAAAQAGADRLRCPAAAGGAGAGSAGHGDDVFGRLRPRQPLCRPRPQHAAGGGADVHRRPGAAAAADGPGCAAVCLGRGPAGGHRAVRHHQEGRHTLAQRGHGDPAQ